MAIDFSKVTFKEKLTYEEYAQTIKTAIELCFDKDGNYLSYVKRIAIAYSCLLYCSNADKDELTLTSVFDIITTDTKAIMDGALMIETAQGDMCSDVYQALYSDFESGLEQRRVKEAHKYSALCQVLDNVVGSLGGVDTVTGIVNILIDTVLGDNNDNGDIVQSSNEEVDT